MRRIIIAAILAAVTARADMEWETAIGQRDQVTRGLVAYWAMRNSGTTVYDEYGANNGTALNVAFSADYSAVGYGASFLSTTNNSEINVSGVVASISANTSGSVSVWVNIADSTPVETRRLFGASDGATGYYITFNITTDGKINCALVRPTFSTQWRVVTDSAVLADNTWVHAVIVQNGTSPVLYVNGALVAQTVDITLDSTLWFAALTGLSGAKIGRFEAQTVTIGSMYLDEFRIYNRALTADEVKQLYRMGAIPKGIK